jgi:fumarylacetoacetase
VNETHDPKRTSWVDSARGHADFPIQNLPYGIFRRSGRDSSPAVGVAIGQEILDIPAARATGAFSERAGKAAQACANPSLNALMAPSIGRPCVPQ